MTNNTSKAAQQTEQQNAMREQVVINTRILALKQAQKLAAIRSIGYGDTACKHTSAEELLADAEKIAAFLTENIQSIKPKSSLVVTGVMPPPAAGFKPGDGA